MMVRTDAKRRRAEPPESDEEPDLVRQYLTQISSTPLLNAEEEVELGRRVQQGARAAALLRESDAGERTVPPERRAELEEAAREGRQAKDHMIRANLRLVVSVAKKYSRHGLPFLDVVQQGNLGLIRAVEKFDHTRGFKFSTYAVWWIRQAIQRGLAAQARTIRLPIDVVEELARVGRLERELQLGLGREPTPEEVAEHAGITVGRLSELRRLARTSVSLDAPVGEDGDTRVRDLITETEVLQAAEVAEYRAMAEELRARIDTLPAQEAMVISLRYGLHNGRPRSLREITRQTGLGSKRIRSLERSALARLRGSAQGDARPAGERRSGRPDRD
ncbi:sigma-70 family RNA polymerase sigma factor [Actinomadura formosensis]|uniref:sigma-70 family RNA polymerase sigma factor n=1 Tax=Actinomadura formosensis TaxID=60706 RepID=UPI000A71791C|nr:sigma-70 family RNA polymerase sigma factor [Actinomadura formosensis]